MGCVIKYKGQSIPEEQFLQYLNKQIAINNLFEENRQFSSGIYEALGFEGLNNLSININRTKNRLNVEIKSKTNESKIDLDIKNNYAFVTNTFVREGNKGFGTLSYIKLANELKKQGLILSSDLNGIDLQESGKKLWESLTRKNLAFYNPSLGRYVFSQQQALQLYSKYLDTNPIVERGSKQDIEGFKEFVKTSKVKEIKPEGLPSINRTNKTCK